MPYPIVHLMFFVFCFSSSALYGFANTARSEGVHWTDWWHLVLLLMLGGFFSLLPDIPAVWNFLLHGTLSHTMAGPVPTHSLVFCSLAFFSTALIGLLLYRHRGKAMALGIFAWAASLSHLLLDDVADGAITYFYPFYNRTMNLFSYADVDLAEVNFMYYNLAGMVIVLFVSCIMLMTIWSLNYLGFGFRYRPFKPGVTDAEPRYDKTDVISGCSSKGVEATDTARNEK
ncbi:MAG: hypothetical protein A4E24_01478 [Methanomethylovorans sp. PtaU1.Bin093]|uniref:metal-dependent hydrolase n=1 Tax=Methanomethylovorans sp. PtaU1.Bin093 TaxID=1811679 RepID=UPI0009CCFA98|nr:metal-dependent hydrolase [Methanomethylovorans sp. PtaU1.Bin093]OPY19888.1 MAG: hypothetical protein A4E24_01478 [Methanomethylovorans sp. PtaU1.Bin093]